MRECLNATESPHSVHIYRYMYTIIVILESASVQNNTPVVISKTPESGLKWVRSEQ